MATRPKSKANMWPLGEWFKEHRGRMSIRQAAKRADISESRWRQVEAGVQKMAGGIEVPVHPRPETVVAMCRAISADPRRGLELAGHNPEQYGWLLDDLAEPLDESDHVEWFASLPLVEREQVLAELLRAHVEAENNTRKTSPRRRTAG